jgi:hypothetical protein
MVHVSVQVVSSYVTPWLSNTCLISVISFVITLYLAQWHQKQDITYAASHFKQWKSTNSEELYILFAVIMPTVKMKKINSGILMYG